MTTILAKFIITCLACEFIEIAAGVPLKDAHNQEHNARIKRSPNSIFGIKSQFTVPDPVKAAQQAIHKFGQLFTPAYAPASKNGKNEKPTEIQYTSYDIKHIIETTTSLASIRGVDKDIPVSSSDIDVKSSTMIQNNGLGNSNSSKSTQTSNINVITDTSHKHSNDTNKKNEDVPIDKDFIDFVFKDLKNENIKDSTSTTEDSTLEYTTETGEYTTLDDLLRIPAPVVATLLG